MVKTYKDDEGHSIKDFLHFGYDHIDTGLFLMERGNPYQFCSAGYLLQLGVELVLKAWHLHKFGKFTNTHKLEQLYKELASKDILADHLKKLDDFYFLRYPRRVEGVVEIGQDDLGGIKFFLDILWNNLPEELLKIYKSIEPNKKGGTILIEKPKERDDK